MDFCMIRDKTTSHKSNCGMRIMEQCIANTLEGMTYSAQKDFPFVKALVLCQLKDFIAEHRLYIYDVDSMVKIYSKVKKIHRVAGKQNESIGGLSKIFLYQVNWLNDMLAYFNELGNFPKRQFITINDFVNHIRGDEDFTRVRIRWYKRIEKLGAEDLRLIIDGKHAVKHHSGYLYSVDDLIAIERKYAERANRLKSKKSRNPE